MKKYSFVIIIFYLTLQIKAQTVSDVDGNVYNTVTIGTQIWMKENLKSIHYTNGEAIPAVTNDASWTALSTGAYCDNNNLTSNGTKYGHLYNYYAIVDSRKLCPVDWHVPTGDDWSLLVTTLGIDAAGKMKTTTTDWQTPNIGATNECGFSGLPGGYRDYGGYYSAPIGVGAFFWGSTENYDIALHSNSSEIQDIFAQWSKNNGLSVRCLKDSNSTEQVTVTFNVDGGSAIPILTVNKNATITKPTDPTKPGYVFVGWYKEAAYTNTWNFITDVVTTNITLFAKWTAATFIENKQLAGFKLYPNPARDKLYIDFNSLAISGGIYDLQGKRVVEIMTGATQIDISNLSKEVYIVKIISSGNIFVDKLIKE